MKKLSVVIVIFAGFLIAFSGCKKDPVDLENSYMDVITGTQGLWIGENDLRYVANMSPGTLSGDGETTIKYSSEADPEGFTIESAYYASTITSGQDVYNIHTIDRTIDVAAYTDADDAVLKVNPAGDVVTIDIGDGAFVETVDFEGKQENLLVARISIGGTGYISGSVKYYNETEERPEITMYSESDQTAIVTGPDLAMGEDGYRASGADVSEHFGHTQYSVVLLYDQEENPGWDNQVRVNYDSDTFYVELDGKTYSMPINGESSYYQIIMTPED
ncbi:MAG: hypothetical protein PF448_12100 [Bacteroidales bacterium]|jgi:hypothetical protein|nr:hypothetical protein [Bacteroidales bacterium]